MNKVLIKKILIGSLLFISSCYTIVREPTAKSEKPKTETREEYTSPEYSYQNYNFYSYSPYFSPYYNSYWFYGDPWSYQYYWRYRRFSPYYYPYYGYSYWDPWFYSGYYDPFFSYYYPYYYSPYYYGLYYPYSYYPYGYYYPRHRRDRDNNDETYTPSIQIGRPVITHQREKKENEPDNSLPSYLNMPLTSSPAPSSTQFNPGAGGTSVTKTATFDHTLKPKESSPALPPLNPNPTDSDIIPIKRNNTYKPTPLNQPKLDPPAKTQTKEIIEVSPKTPSNTYSPPPSSRHSETRTEIKETARPATQSTQSTPSSPNSNTTTRSRQKKD